MQECKHSDMRAGFDFGDANEREHTPHAQTGHRNTLVWAMAGLFLTVAKGWHKELRRFVREGVFSIEARDKNGLTAIFHAAVMDRPKTIATLLDCGANVNAVGLADGMTPLMLAAGMGHEKAVVALLSGGADVDAVNASRSTALYHATLFRRTGCIRLLAAAGADLDRISWTGAQRDTALTVASKVGCPRACEALLESGATVVTGDSWNAPLACAATVDIAEVLLPFHSREEVAAALPRARYFAAVLPRVDGHDRNAVRIAMNEWVCGTHRLQVARRAAEAELLASRDDFPVEIASLCGEYMHAGREAASPVYEI